MPDKRVAYIDVDDTIIQWNCSTVEAGHLLLQGPDTSFIVRPIEQHITLIKELRTVGWQIVVWSQGGSDHAERVVKLLGIENLVDLIVSKPTVYVDDIPFEQQCIKRIYKVVLK